MVKIFFAKVPVLAAALALTAGFFAAAQWADAAATYFVRADGGSPEQCTGRTNAPYPGSGTGRPCAWDHPFRALPPGGTPRISGGDTLLIAPGSYKMGLGAPGAGNCEAEYAWDCCMPPVPSGPDPSRPTRILGQGWDTGCANPPELWGTERASRILDLTGSDNVEIACLEITDHSQCVESHDDGNLACERDTPPFGPWALTGIYAEDSSNVHLRDLDIHGLAETGVRAGRLRDWTVEDVRIAANGWAGWDGDLDGEDANSGTLRFTRWTVEWNGCGETYPGKEPTGCWSSYGDGVGTGATGGNWIIEDSRFLHNTSDGLDLLYHTLGGKVVLNRVHAEGNAGNQVKVRGDMTMTNSVLVGNCAFFEGKPFTHNVDPCRALGNTLEVSYTGGEAAVITNSTFYGQGDGLIGGGAEGGFSCLGTESLQVWNSVFLGDTDFFDSGDVTFLYYQEGCGDLKMMSNYNTVFRAKNISCGKETAYVMSGAEDRCVDPMLQGPFSGTAYGMKPKPGSPALDSGTSVGAPEADILGISRPQGPGVDRGAYERPAGDLPPVPKIEVNGSEAPGPTTTSSPVSVTISLDAGDFNGKKGDLWLGYYSPEGGLKYFDLGKLSLVPGFNVTYSGVLVHFGWVRVLRLAGLVPGTHIFFLAVDTRMNGTLDAAEFQMGYVVVNVAKEP